MAEANRYEFLELLGRGGMGEVYRGRLLGSHGFRKPVAIKRLRQELAEDARFVDRLVEEAKLLVPLQHSNLVSVLDLGRYDEDVFIALEFVDGPDLGTFLAAARKRSQHVSLGIGVHVMRSVSEGVAFAHEQPGGAVVHADLSPANVLLSRAGEVKVTDFGIARREGTGRTTVEGKWPYMAPEQVRGEPLTVASDIYSLGVMLYEVVAGVRPFAGSDNQAIAEGVLAGRYHPLRQHRPEAPPELERVCTRAMSLDPTRRFERARDFAAALADVAYAQRWRSGAPELKEQIAHWVKPRQKLTRSKMQVLMSDLGIAAVQTGNTEATPTRSLTGTVVKPESLHANPSRVSDPIRKPGRGGRWLAIALVGGVVAAMSLLVAGGGGEGSEAARSGPVTSSRSDAAMVAISPRQDAAPPLDAAVAASDARLRRARPTVNGKSRIQRPTRARLPQRRGYVVLGSQPWAYVYRNGRRLGETHERIRLTAGRHRLSLKNPETGHVGAVTVIIRAGETTRRSVILRKR